MKQNSKKKNRNLGITPGKNSNQNYFMRQSLNEFMKDTSLGILNSDLSVESKISLKGPQL